MEVAMPYFKIKYEFEQTLEGFVEADSKEEVESWIEGKENVNSGFPELEWLVEFRKKDSGTLLECVEMRAI